MIQSVNKFSKTIARLLGDDEGTMTVTYAMLFLLVLLVALTAITMLGQASAGP